MVRAAALSSGRVFSYRCHLPWAQASTPLEAGTACLDPLGGSGLGVALDVATENHRDRRVP